MSFLDILKEKLAGSREFNQNADREVLGGTSTIPYQPGISEQDAYKLALAESVRRANEKATYDREIANNYDSSRQYVDDARLLKRMHWDTPEAYEAAVRSDAFDDRIDHGLAAKWMESYRGR